MGTSSLSVLFAKAHEVFCAAIVESGFDRYFEPGTHKEQLLLALSDESETTFVRFAAALNLAVAGDKQAISVLRLVFDSPGFAATEFCIEQGLAALALAILGDVDSLPRVRSCSRIRLSGYLADIARVLLEETSSRASR